MTSAVQVEPEPRASEVPRRERLAFSFDGRVGDYFKIWIVNMCLTLLTFGVFSAWAKVRKKRFIYAHTRLDGTPFEYLGRPLPILRGRIVAVLLFAAWSIAPRLSRFAIPVVLALAALVLPWVIARSAAFNARTTAYRNITFDFTRGYVAALAMLLGGAIVTVITLGFGFPLWRHRLARFLVQGTSFGGVRAAFLATSRPFTKAYYAAIFGGALTFGVSMAVLGALVKLTPESVGTPVMLGCLGAIAYAIYTAGYAYLQARTRNVVWNRTLLGPLSFRSSLRARDMFRLYVENALAIVASCGLLVPWAEIRMLRYRASRFAVFSAGGLEEFEGTPRRGAGAAGAEVADFFDLDVAL